MEVIFVRHAETKNNINGTIQGPEHGDINKKGEKEIERVSQLLKNKKIDVFYSSDTPRCKITSEKINKFHKLQINFTKLIREKNNGDWIGKNYKEVNWDKLRGSFETRKANNGENLIEVNLRVKEFVKELIQKYSKTDKRILVVSHATFLKILIGNLLGMKMKNSIFNLKINHCSPIIISFKDITFENKNHKNIPKISL